MEKYQQYVNSGFEWIGDIPVQWNNLRLRFVCEFRNGYTPSKANPEFWEDGTIPWYRMEDIRDSGRKLEEAKQYVTKDAILIWFKISLIIFVWAMFILFRIQRINRNLNIFFVLRSFSVTMHIII